MSLAEIQAAIPHREPFLLLDEIVERDERRIVCRKTFRRTNTFMPATIRSYPLTPGVLLCEAAMQAGAVLLSGHVPSGSGRCPSAGGHADERRPLQADGQAGRNRSRSKSS